MAVGYSQEIKDNKIDSNFTHSFSLGWSNPLSYISTNMTNSSYNDSIFGILIDYQFLDEKKTINRFHLKFSPFYLNSNLTMSNFLISYTKGRTIYHKNKISKAKLYLVICLGVARKTILGLS